MVFSGGAESVKKVDRHEVVEPNSEYLCHQGLPLVVNNSQIKLV